MKSRGSQNKFVSLWTQAEVVVPSGHYELRPLPTLTLASCRQNCEKRR